MEVITDSDKITPQMKKLLENKGTQCYTVKAGKDCFLSFPALYFLILFFKGGKPQVDISARSRSLPSKYYTMAWVELGRKAAWGGPSIL